MDQRLATGPGGGDEGQCAHRKREERQGDKAAIISLGSRLSMLPSWRDGNSGHLEEAVAPVAA